MKNSKGFLLSAGFGTRFKPQSLFLPKPALPFLNRPQALYPAAALKSVGVDDFFYNSHHLPLELNNALQPYFKRKSICEKEILDSAGGIENAKKHLDDQENFWVANGDSLVFLKDQNVLKEALELHHKENALATLVGIEKAAENGSGLNFNKESHLTGISKSPDALHFVGLFIFNRSIFDHLKKGKHHIFNDILLNGKSGKVLVFDAKKRISWFETGNEVDFINATNFCLSDLREHKGKSSVYQSLSQWDQKIDQNLEHFLKYKVWGSAYKPTHSLSNFLCIGPGTSGDFSKLDNSVLGSNLNFESQQAFKNRLLVHSSQWT